MTDRELLQQALCALLNYPLTEGQAIQALRTRLAQPEAKVFGWLEMDDISEECFVQLEEKPTWGGYWIPLYTTPPNKEWVGLTDDERTYLAWESNNGVHCVAMTEAKLKDKNT